MLREATANDVAAVDAAFRTDIPAVFAPGAQWIWDDGEASPRNAWRFFRRAFTPDANLTGATLRVTADTRYVAYVNGQRVGQGPVRGFPWRWMVDSWDVGHLLRPGQQNVVAILVLHNGVSTFVDIGNRGGLLAQLELAYDERSEWVVTDPGWRVTTPEGYATRANRMSCQLGFSEQIDARLMPDGWTAPGFDDDGWVSATAIADPGAGPWPNLVLRDIPPLAEHLVRPTHLERLAFVRPFAQTVTVDLRNQMSPESAHHANHITYAGYLITLVRVAAADDVTVAIPWSRFNGLGIDGDWHDRARMAEGPGGQRAVTARLAPGDHWLVIEVARADHGDGFQVALDGTKPGSVSLASPLGDDAETPFVTIRCGVSGKPTTGYAPEVPVIPEETRAKARGLATIEAFHELGAQIEPVPAALVSPVDLFTLSTQPRERAEQPIPSTLQAIVAGNPIVVPAAPGRDTELIFDLGREFSGFVTFELSAPAGVTVDTYGFEYLRGDHAEYTDRLDNAFRYVTRDGRQQYTSPTRRGMRFLQLTVRRPDDAAGEITLHDLAVIESHFPVSRVGRFRSSDARLDDIWELSRRTVLTCMEDTYVDCPAYEQTYWVGDAYNSARFATAVFGAEALTERCLRLVPASVRQTPYMASQVPSGWVNVIPNWTFLWIMTCRSHWLRTGDTSFAADLSPAIGLALRTFMEHLNADGLLEITAWNLLDWAPIDQPNEGVVTHQNCLMVMALDGAADLAGASGDTAAAQKWRDAAHRLRASIEAHLWSEEHDGYIDSIHADGARSEVLSVHSHMFALLAGIPEGARAERCQAVLLDPPDDWVRIGSPWMSAFLYDALADLGRTEEALGDIRENYGMMLDHDATTCWEVYPISPVAEDQQQLTRSHCHAWSAAPAAFLPERVLGIRSKAPGWTKVLVAPEPCGLEWAEGSVPLPGEGRIDVSWRIDGAGKMRLEVRAPSGIELDARLPKGVAGEVVRLG